MTKFYINLTLSHLNALTMKEAAYGYLFNR